MVRFSNDSQNLSNEIQKYTNETTFSANYQGITTINHMAVGGALWVKLQDDNTNRIVSFSSDGERWLAFHTIGRTDFLTADEVWFGVNAYSQDTGITIFHWG